MNADALVGRVIMAMIVDKYPPDDPVTGTVQSTFGNGTAIIVDQHKNIIHVRLNGAKVVER